MTSSPFITVSALADSLDATRDATRDGARDGTEPPVVIDATYLLEKAEFDGDYRSGSAAAHFAEQHIPGALYVDIQQQFSDADAPTHYTHPEPQAIVDELARLGVGRHRTVVIYDTTHTPFAARLWYLLTWVGVDARVLDGGLAAWEAAGHPLESGDASPLGAIAPWPAETVREAWITKDELVNRSTTDSRPLVCGLPSASFSGADASRYSRRGHIPGSVNVSSRDLFAPDGTVRGEKELREAYISEGVTGDEEVLLYCGGGISATSNALTLFELGVTAVRVYDGSLEEWSADSSLPLELGETQQY